MRRYVAMLVLSSLTGCGLFQVERPVISLDYGAAVLAYADAKATYVLLLRSISDACRSHKIGSEACGEVAQIHERVQMADAFIRSGLRDPQRPIDWEKVTMLLGAVVSLALKAVP